MILSKILFVDFSLLKHNLESLFKLNSVLDLNFNYRKKCYCVKKVTTFFPQLQFYPLLEKDLLSTAMKLRWYVKYVMNYCKKKNVVHNQIPQ